mmetsp:Transcript_12615/g.41564  ORF Transcript_12615/g.41564 Transcript_12615/m.41564 type:complete len:355 (+) Transcript_12615:548-1612(+)
MCVRSCIHICARLPSCSGSLGRLGITARTSSPRRMTRRASATRMTVRGGRLNSLSSRRSCTSSMHMSSICSRSSLSHLFLRTARCHPAAAVLVLVVISLTRSFAILTSTSALNDVLIPCITETRRVLGIRCTSGAALEESIAPIKSAASSSSKVSSRRCAVSTDMRFSTSLPVLRSGTRCSNAFAALSGRLWSSSAKRFSPDCDTITSFGIAAVRAPAFNGSSAASAARVSTMSAGDRTAHRVLKSISRVSSSTLFRRAASVAGSANSRRASVRAFPFFINPANISPAPFAAPMCCSTARQSSRSICISVSQARCLSMLQSTSVFHWRSFISSSSDAASRTSMMDSIADATLAS